VIFTGGVGENSPLLRRSICEGLEAIGLRLDASKNEAMTDGATGEINAPDAKLKAFVIPTNEELLIARDTFRVLTGSGQVQILATATDG
jgi:acetate kinase